MNALSARVNAFFAAVKLQGQRSKFFKFEQQPKFSQLPLQCTTTLHNLEIVAIIASEIISLTNPGKLLNCHHFDQHTI